MHLQPVIAASFPALTLGEQPRHGEVRKRRVRVLRAAPGWGWG